MAAIGARPGTHRRGCKTGRVDADATLRAQVRARLRGWEEVAAVRRAELAELDEEEAGRIADDLLQLLTVLPPKPDYDSGLIEQQRLFRLLAPP